MEGFEMTVESVEVTPDASGNVKVDVPAGMQTEVAADKTEASEFSGKPGDIMQDLAVLARERTIRNAPPAVVPEPVKAVEPEQPATAPVTPVPDKFKNPDGTVNEEKVAKSTHSAEEALQKYAEIERNLRQKQNEVAALRQPAQTQPPANTIPVNVPLSPLAHAMAQDLINEAAAQGLTLDPRLAVAQARVMEKGLDAKHSAELSVTQDIRQRLEDQERRRELEAIKDQDPWVISPEGIETLAKIRESRPHVNASKTPWTAAYREFLADQVMSQRLNGTVQNPTPKAVTAKAPPTPVNAAQRVVVKPTAPALESMNSDQINAYAASLGPKAEAEFWRSRGLHFK